MMPRKRYPALLGVAYLLTFVAGGHGAAFLIQTLQYPDAFADTPRINFLHALVYLLILSCFFQRQPWLYFVYFLGATLVAVANPLLALPGEIYFPVTPISQMPLLLVSLRFYQLSSRHFEREGLQLQFSLDDLFKTIVFAGLVAIVYKVCLVR